MSIAVGIAFIVLGAIFKFAVSGGKIGGLDLHVVGVILILAGIVGIALPMLIRNRARFARPIARSRQDVADERSRTVVEHTDGSQTLVEHEDGAQTFVEHFEVGTAPSDGQRTPGPRRPWEGSDQNLSGPDLAGRCWPGTGSPLPASRVRASHRFRPRGRWYLLQEACAG
jgi:hypothetical protein